MNKSTPLIIGGVILIGLIVYFALFQPTHFNWRAEYKEDGKDPYDVKVLHKLLEKKFDITTFDKRVEEELEIEGDEIASTTYLYIGNPPQYSEDEAWHLKQYVQAGGNAMIITDHIPDSLAQFLFYPEDCGSMTDWMGQNHTEYDEKVYAHFNHPSISADFYDFEYYYEHLLRTKYWSYIPQGVFCNSEDREYPIAELGSFDMTDKKQGYTNFIRIKVGKGNFYFHTNPIMFGNYYMIDSAGFEYANHVFSHISTDKIYWDKESEKRPEESEKKARDRPSVPAQSPLEYIFSQTSLRWSWYLFLGVGLLYVLFRAKRKQRRIPILEANRNTSLEFVETIGTLYFQQQDHKGIIRKQMNSFLAHLRQRYHLVTKDMDQKLIDRIVVRSRVDEVIVKDIFNEYFRLKKYLHKPTGKVSVDVLNNFYLLVERFHQAEQKNKFEKK